MIKQGQDNGDVCQDGGLSKLHRNTVQRLETVLGTVANPFFEQQLVVQREAYLTEVERQKNTFGKLREEPQERLNASEHALNERKRQTETALCQLNTLKMLQEKGSQKTDEKLGKLAAQCDGAQGSLDHLNPEVKRLEALVQQQASAAEVTEASIARLSARMVLTRRIVWILSAALAANFSLIFERPGTRQLPPIHLSRERGQRKASPWYCLRELSFFVSLLWKTQVGPHLRPIPGGDLDRGGRRRIPRNHGRGQMNKGWLH